MNRLLGVPLAVLLAACGGSGNSTGSGSCTWHGACGGDNVGSWKLQSACMLGTPAPPPSCPAQTAQHSGQISGTLDYAADFSYTANLTLKGTETVHTPASCLAGVTDCASLEAYYANNAGVTSATCTGKPASGCTCTIVTQGSDSETGTWSSSGGTITLGFPWGNTTQDYCVHGNTLTLYFVTPGDEWVAVRN